MNELKSNNKITRSNRYYGGTPSNVSTYVKREEKTYVRRYAMSKKRRSRWVENFYDGDEEAILHPSLRAFKAAEAVADPEIRKKAKLLMACLGIAITMLLVIPAVILTMNYLVIEEVRIEGSRLYSEDELLGACGLDIGEGLPLFKRNAAESQILENLAYVQECEISFELPNVVIFTIEDEAPALCASINGEYYVLTSSLRVLERLDGETYPHELVYVELPRVAKAVVGEEIVLEGTSIEYITEFLRLIDESNLSGRLGRVYFDKKFDIIASVDGRFRVLFGSPSEMELKIASVLNIIEENDAVCGDSGIIDVRVTSVCGITLNANIDPEERE